ncbi:MAG: peptidylprolyl isomerase [bacterium]
MKMGACFLAILMMLTLQSCKKSEEQKRMEEVEKLKQITETVTFSTTKGDIKVGLYGNAMPQTVENFMKYVKSDFYAGTVFHRVVPGFVIQGGGFTKDMVQKETRPPVKLEIPPLVEERYLKEESESHEKKLLLKHDPMMLSMARRRDPHSATSQFFITLAETPHLDPLEPYDGSSGYAVFGKVLEGEEFVRAIESEKTENISGHRNVPVQLPEITKTVIIKDQQKEKK